MNIAVGSMWRDSASYIDRTLAQCAELAEQLQWKGDHCRFIWVENSSTDNTFDRLASFEGDVTLIKREDDCPYFDSVDIRPRWQHLAWVANAVLEDVSEADHRFIYVESDLAWEPATMLRLLEHLDDVDVVSPLNVRPSGAYYDTWGSRGNDGRRFSAHPPYHPDLEPGGMVQVQSVAGCTAMIADVARMCRFSPDDCYVGWNRDMHLAGFDVWCDPTLKVTHA